MNTKVTIIMPVYNAEEYLAETLNSILAQTLQEIELITVDDGSKDKSLKILQKYQAKFSDMTIVTQKNSGPSAARNRGIKLAKGEFVFFLDADDILVNDALERLYQAASEEDADLVIAKYDIFNEIRRYGVDNLNEIVKMKEIPWNHRGILWTFACWNKLFRKKVITENELVFPPISYSEDGAFVMQFVYKAKKITGLNRVVLHYRRMLSASHASITSGVSIGKIEDYLEAHEIIYRAMQEKYLCEYTGYADFKLLEKDKEEVNSYSNEFIKKEITILLNQFYRYFWAMPEEAIALVERNIEKLFSRINMDVFYQIATQHPDLQLKKLPTTYDNALTEAHISVLLYASHQEEQEFIQCLKSLCTQSLVLYKIMVPESMELVVRKNIENCHQVIFVNGKDKNTFLQNAREILDTEYVLVADRYFVYDRSALLWMYKLITSMRLEFLTVTMHVQSENRALQSSFHARVMRKIKNYRRGCIAKKADGILGNKIIKTKYFREICEQGVENEKDFVKKMYHQGYFAVTSRCLVVYEKGDEVELRKYMLADKEESIRDEKEVSLNDPRFSADEIEVLTKLMPAKIKKKSRWKRRVLKLIGLLPLRNRVLIFSIRRNKELDDNLKNVVPHISGKKIIASRQLPHSSLYKLKMYYYVATSKVILTDDYVRYLRVFPLKKEQRVIQLWHACGAFKKFGIHGTNLSGQAERATHIQYNLVSVSAESIKPVYASAFDIEEEKIAALGVPRTDMFFDNDYMEERRKFVFERYPMLKNKEILLYAPTFRDVNRNRTKFEPDLDFAELSKSLLDNQIMIIAPHPVMTEPILKEDYPNIKEIRDVRTIDFMFVANILITDYSSVIFEFCLLRKPIVFFCYDLDIYNRGFYLDFEKDLPGEIIKDSKKLIEYLTSEKRHILSDRYEDYIERYMGACDGNSSKRIADIINKYMRTK